MNWEAVLSIRIALKNDMIGLGNTRGQEEKSQGKCRQQEIVLEKIKAEM